MGSYVCPNGHGQFSIGKRVVGKIGGAIAGAAAGGATKNPLFVLFGALIGVGVGHYLDEQVLPTCPECRVVLQIVDMGFA